MHRNRKRTSISAKKLAYMLMVLLAVTGLANPQSGPETSEEARIERVLSGLRPPIAIKGQPPVRWTLAERMADSHVPGLSIAVIDDGKIAWARGFGVREAGTNEPVTTSTLFEAQSISKAVAATATLVLVNSGRLSLDESPNAYLKSWKLPYNEYQAHEKVTLRRILSHSSGLTVGGFAGYRTGEAIPTLLQILNGEKPANNPPIRVDFTPGSMSRYSGGGAEVMQQLLMDVTGQPFPELMKRLGAGAGRNDVEHLRAASSGSAMVRSCHRPRWRGSRHQGQMADSSRRWRLAACGRRRRTLQSGRWKSPTPGGEAKANSSPSRLRPRCLQFKRLLTAWVWSLREPVRASSFLMEDRTPASAHSS